MDRAETWNLKKFIGVVKFAFVLCSLYEAHGTRFNTKFY